MIELDLSRIDPLKWELARARAQAVQAYLALPKRSGAERDRLSAALGISSNLFTRMVAAWRAGQQAKALRLGDRGSRESPRLPARSREILRDAIILQGSNSRLKDVMATVLSQCAKERVTGPSKAAIHHNLMRARQHHPAANVEPLITLGELLINLPCETADGELDRFKLLVAVEVASRYIVGYRITPEAAPPDYRELLEEVRSRGHELPIVVDERIARELSADHANSLGLLFESQGSVRRRLNRTFGSALNGLQVIYRPSAAVSVDRLRAKKNGRTISAAMAVEALHLAVAEHNSRWPLGPGMALAA